MITGIRERIDGYHAIYTDERGNSCCVKGTFALGPQMSWYDKHGDYHVICGHDQKRSLGEAIRIKPA